MAIGSPDASPMSPDDAYEILSNHRRRMVIYYLRQIDDSANVNELTDQIASWENEIPAEELTSQQRKRVYVSLYQTHLPKLANANIIEYDPDSGNVQLTQNARNVDAYLSTTEESSYPWMLHYLGIATIGAFLILLQSIEAPVIGAIPDLWLSIAIALGLLVSAGVQYAVTIRKRDEIPDELGRFES